jgi:hypothetical protein
MHDANDDRDQEMADEAEQDMDVLRRHAAMLGEHFDTIQIFVTRHVAEDDDTITAHYGTGHWLARLGQVRDWVIQQDERVRCRTRREDED